MSACAVCATELAAAARFCFTCGAELYATGDRRTVAAFVDLVEEQRDTPLRTSLQAHLARAQAFLAAGEAGSEDVVPVRLREALELAREWGSPVVVARCEDDLGTWLLRQGRPEEAAPLLASARTAYERLGATRWLRDLDAATAVVGVGAPVTVEKDF